jgi:hypothetical protein
MRAATAMMTPVVTTAAGMAGTTAMTATLSKKGVVLVNRLVTGDHASRALEISFRDHCYCTCNSLDSTDQME